jgi:hypothetical protein
MRALDSFARPKLTKLHVVIEKIPPTMPKCKFENLKNLGSWSNYRSSLPNDKENVVTIQPLQRKLILNEMFSWHLNLSFRKHVKVILSNIRISDSSDMLARFLARSCRFMNAYEKGLNGKQAACASKKFRGHCVLPESIFHDLNEPNIV